LQKNIPIIVVRPFITHGNVIGGVQLTLQPTLGREHAILAYKGQYEAHRR